MNEVQVLEEGARVRITSVGLEGVVVYDFGGPCDQLCALILSAHCVDVRVDPSTVATFNRSELEVIE